MLGTTHKPDKLMKVPWAAIETKSTIGQQKKQNKPLEAQ
jgi:hypothetical protein